jgi:periplasmic protein TonB
MFDRLVLSSKDQRKGRTGKFLFVTSLFYALALASALIVSVVAASPMMYETMDVIKLASVPSLPPPLGNRIPPNNISRGREAQRPSIYNPENLDNLTNRVSSKPTPDAPVSPPSIGDVGAVVGDGPVGDPNGVKDGIGSIGSKGITGVPGEGIDPPPPPPVQKPVEKPQPAVEKQPLRVSSIVLTGAAIERKTPAYPPLAKQARIEGSVVVEVIISIDGRVEAVRALNGHPLLTSAAVEAARGWRFNPTILNGVPVRVTGLITFNFNLN